MRVIRNFDDAIKATPYELATYLDSVATYKGRYSWLFIPKNSENKVCLVAHIDTVFPLEIKEKEILKEENVWKSPRGIGGDDRCGVYALLHLYTSLPAKNKPMLLFTDGEEIGGTGAREASILFKEHFKEVSYFVELDRHGSVDMVFYNREPDVFVKHIGSYGFVKANGSFSDISILGENLNKCSVNLSVGYYNEHTYREYVNILELKTTIEKVRNLCIEETGKEKIWALNNKHWVF
jgi:hypothetical protein